MENKRIELVEYLLNNGATNTSHQKQHATPFHQACLLNSIEMAQLFLAKGMEVINLPTHKKRSPLHYAVTADHPLLKFIEFLIQKGADINMISDMKGKRTILYSLADCSSWTAPKFEILKYLLENGADPCLIPQDNLLVPLLR